VRCRKLISFGETRGRRLLAQSEFVAMQKSGPIPGVLLTLSPRAGHSST
jgi:hypothetical protein